MIATVVDTTALWQTAIASLAAGVGVTVVFSIAILGVAKMSEANRDGRGAAATVYGVLALVFVLATAAAVVAGVIVMTAK